MISIRFRMLSLLLLVGSIAFAQRRVTAILVQGGPSFSSFYGNNFVKDYRSHLLGFQAGLFIRNEIRKDLFFTTGLRFQKLGSCISDITVTDNFGNRIGRGDIREELNYVSLPVIVAYQFGRRIRFNVEAGAFISRLTKQATKVRTIDPFSNQRINFETTDPYFKDYNGGVLAGADVEIPLQERIRLKLGFRDELGLLTIHNQADENIKTNSLNILAGVAFSL